MFIHRPQQERDFKPVIRSDVSHLIQAFCFSSSVCLALRRSSSVRRIFSWTSLLLKLLNTAANVSFPLHVARCLYFLYFFPVLVWTPALAILSSAESRNVITIRHLAVLNSYITDETGKRNLMELL